MRGTKTQRTQNSQEGKPAEVSWTSINYRANVAAVYGSPEGLSVFLPLQRTDWRFHNLLLPDISVRAFLCWQAGNRIASLSSKPLHILIYASSGTQFIIAIKKMILRSSKCQALDSNFIWRVCTSNLENRSSLGITTMNWKKENVCEKTLKQKHRSKRAWTIQLCV